MIAIYDSLILSMFRRNSWFFFSRFVCTHRRMCVLVTFFRFVLASSVNLVSLGFKTTWRMMISFFLSRPFLFFAHFYFMFLLFCSFLLFYQKRNWFHTDEWFLINPMCAGCVRDVYHSIPKTVCNWSNFECCDIAAEQQQQQQQCLSRVR